MQPLEARPKEPTQPEHSQERLYFVPLLFIPLFLLVTFACVLGTFTYSPVFTESSRVGVYVPISFRQSCSTLDIFGDFVTNLVAEEWESGYDFGLWLFSAMMIGLVVETCKKLLGQCLACVLALLVAYVLSLF